MTLDSRDPGVAAAPDVIKRIFNVEQILGGLAPKIFDLTEGTQVEDVGYSRTATELTANGRWLVKQTKLSSRFAYAQPGMGAILRAAARYQPDLNEDHWALIQDGKFIKGSGTENDVNLAQEVRLYKII